MDYNKDIILNRIFVSYKGSNENDVLEFYSSKESIPHRDCSYNSPIFKIFLQEKQTDTYSIHIMVPKGNSLYYSCPSSIFFSLMYAEI